MMTRRWGVATARVGGLACIVAVLAGCATRTDQVATIYADLQTRTDAYHTAVLESQDPQAIRAETARYVEDMHGLSDNMLEACLDMMGSGMMARGDYDGLQMLMGRFDEAMDAYHGDMDSLTDLEAMWAACDEHYASAQAMFEDMAPRLP